MYMLFANKEFIHSTSCLGSCHVTFHSSLTVQSYEGRSWSYGSWIYNYLCNQCLSPLKLCIRCDPIQDVVRLPKKNKFEKRCKKHLILIRLDISTCIIHTKTILKDKSNTPYKYLPNTVKFIAHQ